MVLTAIVLLALLVGVVVWRAVVVGPGDLQLSVHEAVLPDLPPAFDGFRIAVLSDFHHGPQQPLRRAQRAVSYANAQAPHLTVLLGDYGTSEWAVPSASRRSYERMFGALGPVLAQLRASHGVLGVIGNHDYYAGADQTAEWLRSIGVRVLRGDTHHVSIDDQVLRLVGIDDVYEGDVGADSIAALLTDTTPTIVLSHHPDAVPLFDHPTVQLVLSGHTHGGQVVMPFIGAPVTRSRVCTRLYPAGWVPNPHASLFVSRGIGVQIPIRLGARPEVVVLILRSGGLSPHPVSRVKD